MYRLDNRVQEYAWGSRTAIPELLGRPSPAPRPQAELWLGAHPTAPSSALVDGEWQSLLEVIARAPNDELGTPVVAKFGPALPFLFKVLAAETPLSLQAHPDREQARAGFAAEEALGLAIDAPRRNYKDQNHKPELLCALGRFEMLSGFRRAADTARLLRALDVDTLAEAARSLETEPSAEGLRALSSFLYATSDLDRSALVAAVVDASRRHVEARGEFARECAWAVRISELYPGDVGVIVALLLNLVVLEEGQAVYLSAGNLHAYLNGVGIEIMANSDNVIRGGLTPKHVDVGELLRVLTFADGPMDLVAPRGDGTERVYETPASEFCLSRIELRRSDFRADERHGPDILLCTEGIVKVAARGASLSLEKGTSVFVPARDGSYEARGEGTLFRATVGLV